jgi:hypothetical protein
MKELSKNENRVYERLDKEYESVASITRACRMPRMTVYTVLLRLEHYELARKIKLSDKKTYIWAKIEQSTPTSTNHIKAAIKSYTGVKAIKTLYMDLVTEIPERRMYTFQSSKNFDLWVKKFGNSWVNKSNKAVVDMSLLVFSLYTDNVSRDITDDVEIIKSYKGRRGGSHAIPENYFRYGIATYIFDSRILTIDLQNETAHMVDNELLSSSLISLFKFAFDNTEQDKLFRLHGR